MTALHVDTEALCAEIEAEVVDYQKVFPAPWKLSPRLDLAVRAAHALTAAEHRATRAESQSETRRLDIGYWKERAEGFEAQVDSVRHALTWVDSGETLVVRSRIREALEGTA